MSHTFKNLIIYLAFPFLVFLPKTSYADDQHGHHNDQAHHWHGPHNPDLTLVSGMDDIDSRVLIAADPDPTPQDDVDQTVVQESPNVQPPISSQANGDFIINVPNNAGGYTPVRIQKWGSGYVGPQGEFYYPFPEISQLKAMYGI